MQEMDLRPACEEPKTTADNTDRHGSRQQSNSSGGDKAVEGEFILDQMFGQADVVAKAAGIPATQACTLAQLFLLLRKVTSLFAP